MTPTFSKEQRLEILASMRRFFEEKLDGDLSEIQAGFLLEYFLTEIAPFSYNKGVEDARRFIATMSEDLPGTCFEEGMTYWRKNGGDARGVRRKPGV